MSTAIHTPPLAALTWHPHLGPMVCGVLLLLLAAWVPVLMPLLILFVAFVWAASRYFKRAYRDVDQPVCGQCAKDVKDAVDLHCSHCGGDYREVGIKVPLATLKKQHNSRQRTAMVLGILVAVATMWVIILAYS